MLQYYAVAFFGLVSVTWTLNMSFVQNGYTVVYERMELVSFNHAYYSSVSLHTFKFNRSQAVSNTTLVQIKDMGINYKIEVQAYKFMSNEYRHFPIRFSYSYCQAMSNDDFGIKKAHSCGNIATSPCPHKKATYYICNLYLSGEKFPPLLPPGSYMFDFKWFDGPTQTLFINTYVTAKEIITWN